MSKAGKVQDVAVPILVFLCSLLYYLYNSYPSLTPFIDQHFVASWAAVVDLRLWTLVTHLFLHKEFLHLFIVTLGLITIGIRLENQLGSKWFLEVFFVGGLVGAVNHCMVSEALNRQDAILTGATAPLTGMLVLLALIYRDRTLYWLKVIPFKPVWGATLFVLADLAGLILRGAPMGNGAHIATAFVAVIYYHKILRHRVWRNLRAAGEAQTLEPVRVTKLGWLVPCRHEETFDDTVVFLRDVLGLEIAAQGQPHIDTQIQRFVKFNTPNGSLKVVQPDRTIKTDLFANPMLLITVHDLAAVVRNLDARQVKLVAPVYHEVNTWAIVYVEAPDGRIYQIQGPYAKA